MNKLICHYCFYSIFFNRECFYCSSTNVSSFKLGVEKIMEDLADKFKDYKTVRFDSDSLSTTKKMNQVINDFRDNKITILIGTQMIIKGHDFNNVSLVVIFHPEKYLMLPDFKANERLVSHIYQASGRAGRRDVSGEVIIQSEIPHNYPLSILATHSYEIFYRNEIVLRKKYAYPPFVRLIRLVFRGEENEVVKNFSISKFKELKNFFLEENVIFFRTQSLFIG